jgi:hypothetical protein
MEQYTYPDLDSMRNIDIQCVDPDTIPNTKDINIDIERPILDCVLDYITQAKNPYFSRSGKILAKIEYAETENTIEDCIIGFFRSF